eukprot:5238589-Pleurochrysis_carterae.AAC.1
MREDRRVLVLRRRACTSSWLPLWSQAVKDDAAREIAMGQRRLEESEAERRTASEEVLCRHT